MTLRLPSSFLLGCAALLLATAAEAQVLRPNNTLFIGVRGGASAYGGDIDETIGTEDDFGWLFNPLGYAFGGEVGYQFTPSLGLAISGLYGYYPRLNDPSVPASFPDGGPAVVRNDGESVRELQALFRYAPFASARLSPYVVLGGTFVLGRAFAEGADESDPGGPDSDVEEDPGYGPTLGLGLDLLLGNRLSFFLEATTEFIFPDNAVDQNNPNNTTGEGFDDADFDNLNFYGGGLRFFFKPAGVPVQATLDCATDLTVGESGTFTAYANDDATQPIEYRWNFGDGTEGEGQTVSHAYSAPGTYTVTLEADGPVNTDTETCLVTVVEVPEPPVLANCTATPATVAPGEEVTLNATLSGEEPISVTVDFGDGTTANALPARHAYTATGTYNATITATNADGTDSCTIRVNVGDAFCQEVTELNTVYFDYEMSTLTAEGRARLDENLEVLRRCPNICVVINAYADDREGDKLRLSERRAQEVLAYYVANGIEEGRLRARGLGEAPDANSKEDPGPGDRNARRAESIPVDCSRLDSMGGM